MLAQQTARDLSKLKWYYWSSQTGMGDVHVIGAVYEDETVTRIARHAFPTPPVGDQFWEALADLSQEHHNDG